MVTGNTVDERRLHFELITAGWNDKVACEIPTGSGEPCKRTAHWRINLHGCEQANTCGQHMKAWRRSTLSRFSAAGHAHCTDCDGRARCVHCKQTFADPADAFTVTPL